jgi:hypothetical protein
MSEQINPEEELSFGEKLLGMQGFNAERAKRYRKEMEQVLVHRLSRFERWMLGGEAVVTGGALLVFGIMMAFTKNHPEAPGADAARLTTAMACALTGLLFGAWVLRIAIAGGYARRTGDVMGTIIAFIFCGGWAAGLVQLGLASDDPSLKPKLIGIGLTLFFVLAASLLVSFLQRMHRQTQEKLLRIEYHLAELMERQTT